MAISTAEADTLTLAPTCEQSATPERYRVPMEKRPDFLPSPPGDLERDLYLGRQWRWISPLSFAGFVLIVLSLGFFMYRQPWSTWLILPPVLVSSLGTLLSLATSSRKRRDTLDSHRARVRGWHPEHTPSVDVFLPSAGEELAVLANTYRYVAGLRWPGTLNVYVLDDSARDAVADLARRHGFEYRTRPDRGHFKKAGNLRFGFDSSDGDFIFILDADFVPRSDALLELAPYFDDAEVAIVQSPQFFDVDADMNWLQRSAAATQVLFYRWVQPSRDRSNAAICVGTSALYRRSALRKAGGYALIGHSEDVHTGVRLMRAGYRLRYVPTVVTKGLCPDTLDQFMTQQYRWCTGSMSLLFSKDFHRVPLTPMQRLSYWSGFLYYITTAVNVFSMSIPPILMAWFVSARVTPSNYVFVLMALMVRQSVVSYITLRSDSVLGLARVQTAYSFCHAVALFDTLRGRTDAWVATGVSSRNRTATRVLRLIRWWCGGVQLVLWAAILRWAPVYGVDRWILMIAFTLMNLYVVYPLLIGRADVLTWAQLRRRLQLGVVAWRQYRAAHADRASVGLALQFGRVLLARVGGWLRSCAGSRSGTLNGLLPVRRGSNR